ncbi:MAG TPA: ATP-binding protein [Acidimicrobiales bacterium]|nr:ATP-binding protein [Acidimicrobiales bacterium]
MIQLIDSSLAGLLDASPDAMLAIDDTGLIVMANAQSERLFGYEHLELIGLRVELLVHLMHPSFRPSATGLQMPGRRHDGSEFPASISISTIETDAGSLLSATIRDATERGQVDAELVRVKTEAERVRLEVEADRITAEGEKKEAERVRLEAEVDRVTAEGEKKEAERVRLEAEVDRVTAEGEKTVAERVRLEAEADRVTAEGEKTVAERVRLEAEADRVTAEAEKKEAERVRLEAEADRVTAEGEKTVAEGVRLEAEVERVKAEGEKTVAEGVRLEAEVKRVKAEGEKTVAEGVRLEAVAEHQRLEAQLHQSQRMESLGQLAGGVAHDFNNLLAVIMNYASFVAEELSSAAAGVDGQHWQGPLGDVEQIQLAAERAALLTHQLLSFARREVVQARPLSLNGAVTRMEQILRRTIGEQIELVIKLAHDLPMVVADPGQIEQIVLNLAINARDAMPEGGVLTISTSMRMMADSDSYSGLEQGNYVCFRVSDTGVGMSPEVRDRAFEPFFTTKPRGEGSGLGLATVYGIVSQSGGLTTIYSDLGVGTSLTILLPVATSDTEPSAKAATSVDAAPRQVTETILLVDDEEALREVTRRILTRNGYLVLVAASGREAIEIAGAHEGPIDLLLTDVIMPTMQGPTVANEVRQIRPDIGVLFMSGHAQPVLEAEAVLGTEFLLLEKPFDQSMLLENLRKVLDREG